MQSQQCIYPSFYMNNIRAPVAQSEATRAVNPGVVSSNRSSTTFFSTFDESLFDKFYSSSTNGLTVYMEK